MPIVFSINNFDKYKCQSYLDEQIFVFMLWLVYKVTFSVSFG